MTGRKHIARAPLARTAPRLALVAMLLAVLPAVALAAEGMGGNPWLNLLYKAINFVVIVAIIWYFGRKPLGRFLRDNAAESKAALDERRKAAEAAEAELAEQRRKIDGLEAELRQMVEQARADAESEREQMLEDARHQAERIKQHMAMQVEQEFAKASAELKQQIADEMYRSAQELIEKRMNADLNKRLVDDFIGQMEGRK